MRQFQRQNLDVRGGYGYCTLLNCGNHNLITDLHLSYREGKMLKDQYLDSGHLDERDLEVIKYDV